MKIIIFIILISLSNISLACGTPENWIDAYHGVKTDNKWRDSMNKMESLVMLLGCGSSRLKNPEIENKVFSVLLNAIENKNSILNMPSTHKEIAKEVASYKSPRNLMVLLESIYIRFQCLRGVKDQSKLTELFGEYICSSSRSRWMKVNAPSGAIVRDLPGGTILTTLSNGTKVRIINKEGNWYKIEQEKNLGLHAPRVAYIHESILID